MGVQHSFKQKQVNACKKKDTGRLYAMKQINKKRVQATESTKTIMSEKNFLALMDSDFVTGLRYSFSDESTLYLVLDLMVGGDLKYHLNNERTFPEDRSRFYAAEVLLGLEHIHSKGIIYRDLKLENVLVDNSGLCFLFCFLLVDFLGDECCDASFALWGIESGPPVTSLTHFCLQTNASFPFVIISLGRQQTPFVVLRTPFSSLI